MRHVSPSGFRLLLALLCFAGSANQAIAQESRGTAAGANPAINKPFQQPDYGQWAERLEGESREIYAKREDIVQASGVKPGMSVADVGAGTGFMTMLFARKVGPGGRVIAVDISQTFLDAITKRAARENLGNVGTALGSQTGTDLTDGSMDLIFTSDVYHHFENVASMLASIRNALKPGGRFIVVDFQRIPGTTPERTLSHVRVGKEGVIAEVQAAGFRMVQEVTRLDLKQNYYLIFEKI